MVQALTFVMSTNLDQKEMSALQMKLQRWINYVDA